MKYILFVFLSTLYNAFQALSILLSEFSTVILAFVFVHGAFFADKFVVIVEHISFRLYDTPVIVLCERRLSLFFHIIAVFP